ncbi:MAG: hypothetical protein ACM3RQ_00710 [Methanocella sp.]
MLLARDVLDKQLVDKSGRPMGRVDGIVIAFRPGTRPEVKAIELGSVVVARRLHPRIGRWVLRLARRYHWNGIYRIPWHRIAVGRRGLRADLAAERTRALKVERWLRDEIIARIPGS